MNRLACAVLLAFSLTGCPGPNVPPPANPPPFEADPAKCPDACFIITKHCPQTPLALAQDCIPACQQVESSGYATIHPGCIARATSAADVRLCNFDCK